MKNQKKKKIVEDDDEMGMNLKPVPKQKKQPSRAESSEEEDSIEETREQDLKSYATYGLYVQHKYGVQTISELMEHTERMTVIAEFPGACRIEENLTNEERILEEIDEDEILLIKASQSYADYTREQDTISITMEKLVQVGCRIASKFVYVRKNFQSLFQFFYEGKEHSLGIEEYMDFMKRIYAEAGKKLVLTDSNDFTKAKLVATMMHKRFCVKENDVVPTHVPPMLKFFTKVNEEPVPIPNYISAHSIDMLAKKIINKDVQYPDLTEDSKRIVEGTRPFMNKTVHEFADIINNPAAKDEEVEALAESIAKLPEIELESEEINEFLVRLDKMSEHESLQHSLAETYGAFNVGWYSVNKNPKSTADREKCKLKEKLVSKFSADPYIFLFLKQSSIKFFFIKSKSGKKFASATGLMQYLNVLPKVFHAVTWLGQLNRTTLPEFGQTLSSLFVSLSSLLSTSEAARVALQNQFTMNCNVWRRTVNVWSVGSIKDKYMPVPGIGGYDDVDDVPQDVKPIDLEIEDREGKAIKKVRKKEEKVESTSEEDLQDGRYDKKGTPQEDDDNYDHGGEDDDRLPENPDEALDLDATSQKIEEKGDNPSD